MPATMFNNNPMITNPIDQPTEKSILLAPAPNKITPRNPKKPEINQLHIYYRCIINWPWLCVHVFPLSFVFIKISNKI